VGKTATLCLLYAFPLLFLGAHDGTAALVARVVGWAFAIWGTALYWWAAVLYLEQAPPPGGRCPQPARAVTGARGAGTLAGTGRGHAGHDPGPAAMK
jgi:cardiolipin synthase